MSRRKSRFSQPPNKVHPNPKSVFRDASYFKTLEKTYFDSELTSIVDLLNASELAKSRKTWPFFSEDNGTQVWNFPGQNGR